MKQAGAKVRAIDFVPAIIMEISKAFPFAGIFRARWGASSHLANAKWNCKLIRRSASLQTFIDRLLFILRDGISTDVGMYALIARYNFHSGMISPESRETERARGNLISP